MTTQVIMKKELFGSEIRQQNKTEFFCANDLVAAGNKWRALNGITIFNLGQYFNQKSTQEFILEIENKYNIKAISSTKGRNGSTWVHPLLFIDIALAINPKLKIEVYEWIFDNLIKFRNDSGDSYKEMAAALYIRYNNKREFPTYLSKVAMYIKSQVGVEDWQTATEEQLKKRDKIHDSIKLLCNVLQDTNQAVKLGVQENLK